jgi:hypothetical protein
MPGTGAYVQDTTEWGALIRGPLVNSSFLGARAATGGSVELSGSNPIGVTRTTLRALPSYQVSRAFFSFKLSGTSTDGSGVPITNNAISAKFIIGGTTDALTSTTFRLVKGSRDLVSASSLTVDDFDSGIVGFTGAATGSSMSGYVTDYSGANQTINVGSNEMILTGNAISDIESAPGFLSLVIVQQSFDYDFVQPGVDGTYADTYVFVKKSDIKLSVETGIPIKIDDKSYGGIRSVNGINQATKIFKINGAR